ncbi:hypothetical protein [Enterobacter roggenkampii]|uniref:hypothetical protein n=1 Tax=Enterobacter roggenkampii TaxID=1812935 RepID=UPI003890555A
MTKILTTAEHNQATADLATLTAIVENYAVTHPKKHGWSTLGAFCMPAVFVLVVGYHTMKDIDPGGLTLSGTKTHVKGFWS